ncbi:MAG TPA: transporter [Porphyromonadaceae bacterium]|nr:transporter [Porphyromonadaceae bacterium]
MNIRNLKPTFSLSILLPSLFVIIGLSVFSGIWPDSAYKLLTSIQDNIFRNLSWLYVMVVSIFIFFLLFLVISKYGNIKLGSNTSKPEYSFFSWISMLFAAGMGIGLMYFGVAEPIAHFNTESIHTALDAASKAKNAQLYTFFHWGIHAWSVYAVIGLTLAYFAYRYRLPLSLRSALYPLLKDRIYGKIGDLTDIFALCSTFFGITTTLGFGVVQLNAGLVSLGILPESDFKYQVIIVVLVMSTAIVSALSGLSKGVKMLSQINIVSAIILLLFVLLAGPTVYLLSAFSEGIGFYINKFTSLTFDTHVYEAERLKWFTNWTILYWAWWISWSPYVGLFIAKISKGRTIREFIIAVLIIPSIFNFVWMTIFGSSAIQLDILSGTNALSKLVNNPDIMLFRFLQMLPFSFISSIGALFIICIFFVTSADSGIYILNNIATKNADKSPAWQTIFWGVLLGSTALILLNVGGLASLQTTTLIIALPFSILMLLFCYNLLSALYIDHRYNTTGFSHSTHNWTGKFWKKRLRSILTYSQKTDIKEFIQKTVSPAFEELSIELSEQGIEAEIKINLSGSPHIQLSIEHQSMKNFTYGVKAQKRNISENLINEVNAPSIESQNTFIPFTYFGDGRNGYDIQYFTKEEIISDILRHYERFLFIVSDKRNDLYILEP